MSPPVSVGTTLAGITGDQGPTPSTAAGSRGSADRRGWAGAELTGGETVGDGRPQEVGPRGRYAVALVEADVRPVCRTRARQGHDDGQGRLQAEREGRARRRDDLASLTVKVVCRADDHPPAGRVPGAARTARSVPSARRTSENKDGGS